MSNQFQFQNPYVLPSQNQSVPDSWKSDNNARPVGSSMQTVVVTSLSASQNAGGRVNINLPVGPSSGIMCNPYLKFQLDVANAGNATAGRFAGPARLCTALFNRYVFSINGVQVDSIMNCDFSYDTIIGHSSSADYQKQDLALLMGANVNLVASGGGVVPAQTYCVPLLGSLSAPSFPLYLLNGSCSIDIDLNTAARAFGQGIGAADANSNFDVATTYTISNVQLIYDRVTPSDEFISSVKAEQMSGKKFVVPFTAIQSYLVAQTPLGQSNLNVGVNLSSLNSVVATQVTTADLSSIAASKLSAANGFGNFQVSLDGRLLNSVNYQASNQPAIAFAESQKALQRAWDSAVSDNVSRYIYSVGSPFRDNNDPLYYLNTCFFAACSALRCNDRLAYSGSPCSVLNVQWTNNSATVVSANFMVLAYMQLLIDASGSIELLR